MNRNMLAPVVAFAALVAAVPAGAARSYIATPLTPPGAPTIQDTAINNAGQVTGRAFTTFDYRAFLYSNGELRDLGTLGGTFSVGYGINDSGQVTGTSTTSGNVSSLAFLYSNGAMISLGTLALDSTGYSVNNSGQVAGFFYTDNATSPSPHTHAFLYSGGTMIDLGTLGGLSSIGYDINNRGEVTGTSWINNAPQQHAFIYSNSTMQDIGTLSGGSNSQGYAINDVGQVTGESGTAFPRSETHAFLYTAGTMIDLGTLGGSQSKGLGINRSGEVVGTAEGRNHFNLAFLYADNTMYDLNSLVVSGLSPGSILTGANGINDRGQIVASGFSGTTGRAQSYRLDPVSTSAPNISVPALSKWGLGATVLLLWIGAWGDWRRKRM